MQPSNPNPGALPKPPTGRCLAQGERRSIGVLDFFLLVLGVLQHSSHAFLILEGLCTEKSAHDVQRAPGSHVLSAWSVVPKCGYHVHGQTSKFQGLFGYFHRRPPPLHVLRTTRSARPRLGGAGRPRMPAHDPAHKRKGWRRKANGLARRKHCSNRFESID